MVKGGRDSFSLFASEQASCGKRNLNQMWKKKRILTCRDRRGDQNEWVARTKE
jgi:hypothetical protein